MSSGRRGDRAGRPADVVFRASLATPAPTGGHSALARLVTYGPAAHFHRDQVKIGRAVLLAALKLLRERDLTARILVTPAGLITGHLGEEAPVRHGWNTDQASFDWLGAHALGLARELFTSEVRSLGAGRVGHLVLGVDIWPADRKGPYGETACLCDFTTGEVRLLTGKSYPNTEQQDLLIREPDLASHVVDLGDEKLAVLVCHDLAAWSPRANANAKGYRADVWQRMQECIEQGKPTLAVQLPHTVDTAATWTPPGIASSLDPVVRFVAPRAPSAIAGATGRVTGIRQTQSC